MDKNPETEELLAEQVRREVVESSLADAANDEQEERQHLRRAEKAHYLRQALARRAASERES